MPRRRPWAADPFQLWSSTPARRLAAQLLDVLPVGLMALWGWRLPDRAASGLIFAAVAIVLTRSLVVQRLGVHPSNRSTVGAALAVAAGFIAALVDLSGVGAPGDRSGRAPWACLRRWPSSGSAR